MRKRFPRAKELAVLFVLACVCAASVGLFQARDIGLSALAIPVFIAAAIMGMRRNPAFAPQPIPQPVDARRSSR